MIVALEYIITVPHPTGLTAPCYFFQIQERYELMDPHCGALLLQVLFSGAMDTKGTKKCWLD